jgi:hypothetical protein
VGGGWRGNGAKRNDLASRNPEPPTGDEALTGLLCDAKTFLYQFCKYFILQKHSYHIIHVEQYFAHAPTQSHFHLKLYELFKNNYNHLIPHTMHQKYMAIH